MTQSRRLQVLLDGAVTDLLKAYPNDSFKQSEIAATLIDLRDPNDLQSAGFRGDDVKAAKDEGTLRIGFFGSSTTMDPYVPNDPETWPAVATNDLSLLNANRAFLHRRT